MDVPGNLRYTEEHEWVGVEGKEGTVGISDYAQSELGDVVYVELPQVGRTVNKGDTLGVVESVKAVSDFYAPVGGRVLSVNDAIRDKPELVNQSPYEDGWMVKIELDNPEELDSLMSAEQYLEFVQKEKGS